MCHLRLCSSTLLQLVLVFWVFVPWRWILTDGRLQCPTLSFVHIISSCIIPLFASKLHSSQCSVFTCHVYSSIGSLRKTRQIFSFNLSSFVSVFHSSHTWPRQAQAENRLSSRVSWKIIPKILFSVYPLPRGSFPFCMNRTLILAKHCLST